MTAGAELPASRAAALGAAIVALFALLLFCIFLLVVVRCGTPLVFPRPPTDEKATTTAYLEARVRARKRDAGTDTALDEAKSSDMVRAPRALGARQGGGRGGAPIRHRRDALAILETSLKVGTVVLKRRGEDETGTQVDEGQLMPRDPIVR